jgi:hypothetical protein
MYYNMKYIERFIDCLNEEENGIFRGFSNDDTCYIREYLKKNRYRYLSDFGYTRDQNITLLYTLDKDNLYVEIYESNIEDNTYEIHINRIKTQQKS